MSEFEQTVVLRRTRVLRELIAENVALEEQASRSKAEAVATMRLYHQGVLLLQREMRSGARQPSGEAMQIIREAARRARLFSGSV